MPNSLPNYSRCEIESSWGPNEQSAIDRNRAVTFHSCGHFTGQIPNLLGKPKKSQKNTMQTTPYSIVKPTEERINKNQYHQDGWRRPRRRGLKHFGNRFVSSRIL